MIYPQISEIDAWVQVTNFKDQQSKLDTHMFMVGLSVEHPNYVGI